MRVKIYVEGGGDGKYQRVRCREGFGKLCEKAGFAGRMPAFVACGPRGEAYDSFQTALLNAADGPYPLLLVDSEDPVEGQDPTPDSPMPWAHLERRDGWERPTGAANDQAQLMVTCMETWLMADRAALRGFFGAPLNESALLPQLDLESRGHQQVLASLDGATKDCGTGRVYRKGPRSFQLLAQLDPAVLGARLPHFRRFVATLDRYLA